MLARVTCTPPISPLRNKNLPSGSDFIAVHFQGTLFEMSMDTQRVLDEPLVEWYASGKNLFFKMGRLPLLKCVS